MEALITTEGKRVIAGFVPYREAGGSFEYFLQKRDQHAIMSPGLLGLFGGGVENDESIEQALHREIEEELAYHPEHVMLFSRYETMRGVVSVFIEQVRNDFELQVAVHEGEYGRFFKRDEIENVSGASSLAKLVIPDLDDYLKKQK